MSTWCIGKTSTIHIICLYKIMLFLGDSGLLVCCLTAGTQDAERLVWRRKIQFPLLCVRMNDRNLLDYCCMQDH